MDELPAEVLCVIAEHMQPADLTALACTCSYLAEIVMHETRRRTVALFNTNWRAAVATTPAGAAFEVIMAAGVFKQAPSAKLAGRVLEAICREGRADILLMLHRASVVHTRWPGVLECNAAFQSAAGAGHTDVLELLMRICPRLNPRANQDWALHWAVYNGRAHTVRWLASWLSAAHSARVMFNLCCQALHDHFFRPCCSKGIVFQTERTMCCRDAQATLHTLTDLCDRFCEQHNYNHQEGPQAHTQSNTQAHTQSYTQSYTTCRRLISRSFSG